MRNVFLVNEYVPFLIFGISTGAIYGLSAMGLVLTYKTSGLFNFGHGTLSALAAYIFYAAHDQADMPSWVAAVLAVLIFGVFGGLVFERFAAALANVSITYRIVGTIGLLVGIRALCALIWGGSSRDFTSFLPQDEVFTISGVAVTAQQVIIVAFGTAAAVGLSVFFRFTRLGVAMRAVVDDASLLSMAGSRPVRVRRAAWIIGTTFTAASGVLFAEVQRQVQVDVLTLLIVQAFGAAAIARFSSLPMAFVGGLAIGVVQKLVSKEAGTTTWLQGLDLNVPFVVSLLILIFARRGSLKEVGREVKSRAIGPSRFDSRTQLGGYALAVTGIAALPAVVGTRLPLWNTALALVCLFLSLSLLIRLSGQISLCQFGFAAIGAASFGRMLERDLPWGMALVVAALITAAVGALIAIPAIRLSGLYLGLATLGFGIMLDQFFYTKDFMFGLSQQLATPRPAGFTSDKEYFYLLLAFAVVGSIVVLVVERSRLGRLLRAVADAPVALSTLGTDMRITLVIIFSMSAALAGISGVLFAGLFGQVGGFSFPAIQSLLVLAVLFVAGTRLIVPAFLAPVLLFVVPGYLENNDVFLVLQIGFGVVAFAVAALSATDVDARFAAAADPDRLVGPTDRRFNAPPDRGDHRHRDRELESTPV